MDPKDQILAFLKERMKALDGKQRTKQEEKQYKQLRKTAASPSFKGLTPYQAQAALGPQVGQQTEIKGTAPYQYEYKTPPPKYLIGPDGKPVEQNGQPVINPVYREGKLGSVFLATNLALQSAGGAQADPFSKLGATLAGVFGGIFMKNIGADINYWRATEQAKEDNRNAIATSKAGATAEAARNRVVLSGLQIERAKSAANIAEFNYDKLKDAELAGKASNNFIQAVEDLKGLGEAPEEQPKAVAAMKASIKPILKVAGVNISDEKVDAMDANGLYELFKMYGLKSPTGKTLPDGRIYYETKYNDGWIPALKDGRQLRDEKAIAESHKARAGVVKLTDEQLNEVSKNAAKMYINWRQSLVAKDGTRPFANTSVTGLGANSKAYEWKKYDFFYNLAFSKKQMEVGAKGFDSVNFLNEDDNEDAVDTNKEFNSNMSVPVKPAEAKPRAQGPTQTASTDIGGPQRPGVLPMLSQVYGINAANKYALDPARKNNYATILNELADASLGAALDNRGMFTKEGLETARDMLATARNATGISSERRDAINEIFNVTNKIDSALFNPITAPNVRTNPQQAYKFATLRALAGQGLDQLTFVEDEINKRRPKPTQIDMKFGANKVNLVDYAHEVFPNPDSTKVGKVFEVGFLSNNTPYWQLRFIPSNTNDTPDRNQGKDSIYKNLLNWYNNSYTNASQDYKNKYDKDGIPMPIGNNSEFYLIRLKDNSFILAHIP